MAKLENHNYYRWSVKKGDYKRDSESTWSHQKRIIRRKRIRIAVIIAVYLLSVASIAYLIFGEL